MRLAWLTLFYVAIGFILLVLLELLRLLIFSPTMLLPYRGNHLLTPPAYLLAMYLSESRLLALVASALSFFGLVAIRRAYNSKPVNPWLAAYIVSALLVGAVALAAKAFLWSNSPIPLTATSWSICHSGSLLRTFVIVASMSWPLFAISLLLLVQRLRPPPDPFRVCPRCSYNTVATVQARITRCPECGYELPTGRGT